MKPEFMRLRRALAGAAAALLIAAGIVVLSPALSASAHHNTISVNASCTNFVWSINWTIVNSEYDKSETITSSSDSSIIAKGDTLAKGAKFTKSEVVSGPVTKTLSITAKWSNGVTSSDSRTIYPDDFKGTCERQDSPKVSIDGSTCTSPSAATGNVSFTLTGATSSYTVALMAGSTQKDSVPSTGGSGTFSNVPAGTYTVKAFTSKVAATSGEITVSTCTQVTPEIELVIQPCITGGALGAVTANLSKLVSGSTYLVKLYNSNDVVLDTLSLTASTGSHTSVFPNHGPGSYYVTLSTSAGDQLALSADATILDCTPELIVQLEPCMQPVLGNDRAINVHLEGLATSKAYTVQLLTDDAAQTVVDSTTTLVGNATFTHTFTGVPAPADYVVKVVGGSAPLVSDSISATPCLPTLAPPSIEIQADQCSGVGSTIGALSASMIDLDATKTYYVRIVDSTGTTVAGGEDQQVTGSATASVQFPKITTSGTYSAQLLIDPGKQLAATSPTSVDLKICLPTLAMTGPGVLVPLGSVAALLLTLGGAVVTGRLRRRMAL